MRRTSMMRWIVHKSIHQRDSEGDCHVSRDPVYHKLTVIMRVRSKWVERSGRHIDDRWVTLLIRCPRSTSLRRCSLNGISKKTVLSSNKWFLHIESPNYEKADRFHSKTTSQGSLRMPSNSWNPMMWTLHKLTSKWWTHTAWTSMTDRPSSNNESSDDNAHSNHWASHQPIVPLSANIEKV